VQSEPAAASPVPELPRLSLWTEEDADQLKRFLLGATGQKLVNRLQAVAYKTALDEAHDPSKPKQATGYDFCRKNILSLTETHETPVRREDMEEELGVMERLSP
jgi:hypothetical protein